MIVKKRKGNFMKNKLYKAVVVVAMTTTLSSITVPSIVSADSMTSTSVANTSGEKVFKLSLETQSKIEPYISVKNNQYILDSSVKSVITSSEYNEANKLVKSYK